MATKGASNHFGRTRGGRQGKGDSAINYAWAKAFNKRTLYDHFYRHGKQVNADTKEAYEAHAVKFANTIDKKNNVSFVDKYGSTYKFNKKTGEFAIIIKKGYVITYFKPKNGIQFFNSKRRKEKK